MKPVRGATLKAASKPIAGQTIRRGQSKNAPNLAASRHLGRRPRRESRRFEAFFAPDLIAAKPVKPCDGGVFGALNSLLKKEQNRAGRPELAFAGAANVVPGGPFRFPGSPVFAACGRVLKRRLACRRAGYCAAWLAAVSLVQSLLAGARKAASGQRFFFSAAFAIFV